MNNKLKEIREKWFFPNYTYRLNGYALSDEWFTNGIAVEAK